MSSRIIDKIKSLSPTDFENLTYDLVTTRSLRNCQWRTPGADGGRDIEGDFFAADFSGAIRMERWYVECKRYAQAIDWPTVFEKIAYAENHQADYLLICTTSWPSPDCRNEISARNQRHHGLQVRVWDGSILEEMIAREDLLLAKYSLRANAQYTPHSLQSLTNLSSKFLHAAYGAAVSTASPSRELESAAALAELIDNLATRSINSLTGARGFDAGIDGFDWLDISSAKLSSFDAIALRAALAVFRAFTRGTAILIAQTATGIVCNSVTTAGSTPDPRNLNNAIQAIAMVSNFECRIESSQLLISTRKTSS